MQCLAIDSHILREPNNLFFTDRKLVFKACCLRSRYFLSFLIQIDSKQIGLKFIMQI